MEWGERMGCGSTWSGGERMGWEELARDSERVRTLFEACSGCIQFGSVHGIVHMRRRGAGRVYESVASRHFS